MSPPEAREAILDAVDRLLGRYGYRKMTVEDVARDAGVGKGTIYLHFTSKEELALSSIDRLIGRLAERLRGMANGDDPAPERLRRMLVERVLFRFDNVHQDSQSLDALFAAVRGAFLARREGHFTTEAGILGGVLAAGRKDGTLLFSGAPVPVARTLILATNALLPFSLSARELGSRRTVEAGAGRIADLLLAGLAAGAPRAAGPRSTRER